MGDLQKAPPIISYMPNSGPPGLPSWAHQDLRPGGAINTNIFVPGLRQLAGTNNGVGTKPNKAPLMTNEPRNATITAASWPAGYQHRQVPGDLIFVGNPKERHRRTDMETLNLPQLNTIARNLYKRCLEKATDRYSGMLTEFTPQMQPADPKVKEFVDQLRLYGEDIFNRKSAMEDGLWDDRLSCITGLSRRLLRQRWGKFFGVYLGDSGRGPDFISRTHQTLSVTVGGPTRAQEAKNYWGEVDNGRHLGLVLKRVELSVASRDGRPLYGEFALQPWSGHQGHPDFFEMIYFDDAGLIQYGSFIPVGQVLQQPLDISTEEVCKMAAGLTADELAAKDLNMETVMINAGFRRRWLSNL